MHLVPALWFWGLYGKEITLFLIELCDLFAIVSELNMLPIVQAGSISVQSKNTPNRDKI